MKPAEVNDTHDPNLRSWVESANQANTDFPIQNLPFGVFRCDSHEAFRPGVAIGDQILDLPMLHECRVLQGTASEALAAGTGPNLNVLMALGAEALSLLRRELSRLLRAGAQEVNTLSLALKPQSTAEFAVPAKIGDYTDFYASIHHARTVGTLFRPDNPLLPNYKWVPIAYHGRASSIGVSGQRFQRPASQVVSPGSVRPEVMPTRRLDYELEVGIFVGAGNRLGHPLTIDVAEEHVFGLCLLNDWSARDVQAWEYQPLGPFLAKNFATTISPWVVTLEALAPYRLPYARPAGDPEPLPYLISEQVRRSGAIDIRLEAYLDTVQMRDRKLAPQRLSASNFRHSYWTVAQMIAHHTVNGCNLQPGDLLGSGTQSGPDRAEAGSLLELTSGGKEALSLVSGETRTFLNDGDRVILRGWCEKEGCARVGFGEVVGTVLSAL